MISRPLATIIVNNHNYGDYLAQAINSALAQTYVPLEVVVVDDGSTDHSRAVIAGFGDRIVPVLKPNGGQGSAFNAGFAAARGDIIVYLDADDMLLPTAVESAAEFLREPAVVKVHWPLWEIDANGHRSGGVQPRGDLPDGDVKDLIILKGPTGCITPPTSANAWTRRFLEQVMPVPEAEFRINADGYLVTLGWIYGDVRAVSEPQGLYRVHGANRFASLPEADRERRHLEMYEYRCTALAGHLALMGIAGDPEIWKLRKGRFRWSECVQLARAGIQRQVPAGARFILVDDGAWHGEPSEPFVEGRHQIPFLERDGQYWGRPADGATAVLELERLRRQGADFIAFPWFSFWWLSAYGELDRHLRSSGSCLLENEVLIVFDLRGGGP
jgi:glycosyltransferase involved in cell wall biosynthesis